MGGTPEELMCLGHGNMVFPRWSTGIFHTTSSSPPEIELHLFAKTCFGRWNGSCYSCGQKNNYGSWLRFLSRSEKPSVGKTHPFSAIVPSSRPQLSLLNRLGNWASRPWDALESLTAPQLWPKIANLAKGWRLSTKPWPRRHFLHASSCV